MNEQAHLEPKKSRLQSVGIFVAWAGGLAGGAALLVAIVVLIADLFVAGRLFTLPRFSDGMFYAFVALMIAGVIAPAMTDRTRLAQPDSQDETEDDPEIKRVSGMAPTSPSKSPLGLSEKELDRVRRLARKRMARVYNPWPWRFWVASLIAFGIAVLSGF
jgi:hypothetical protein